MNARAAAAGTAFAPVLREDWLEAPEGLVAVPEGTATTTPGFVAAATACGLKPSGDLDLGLLRSVPPAVSALVDTVNALPSAPVRLNRTRPRGGLQAVLVNAGTANAATGSPGLEDARAMAARAAAGAGLPEEAVAVCSTGTIGERLDLDRVLPAVDAVAGRLAPDGGGDFGRAICTTDAWPKGGAFRLSLGAGEVTIGIAGKGAGMIRPTMATMLAFVTTDAAVAAEDLAAATRSAAARAFNRISVDGQMSPSDTLLVLANGAGPPLTGADLVRFGDGLAAVCRWTAIQMVKDGEGAEHAVRVVVRGARESGEAEAVARAVGESALVKTAVFGRDPNWGRISQAVGQALAARPGVPVDLRVSFDGVPAGDPALARVMERPEYDVEIDLGRGTAEYALWASDLGHAYVTLNAEYHT
ncbi:MAG TPA: bifunctional glutamate N-acetyltransferase/amino-acid acetyltransferase ArgJ [Miltoncostaeaceae bacterium]|nr:bifunctional glutamate N-acetyltransferase/amino-acid acetyltransferase ArgJ [Miltoncostaeaceae bacterium]